MITQLNIKNFCAFKKLDIDFSPKINVIIGENSSGKTQLLKAAYVLSTIGTEFDENEKLTKAKVEQVFTDKLIRTFKPADNKLSELYNRGGNGDAEITANFSMDCKLGAKFTSRSKKTQVTGKYNSPYGQGAVYIPTKEILSFLEGISNDASDVDTLNRLFDRTYFDLAEKLLEQQSEEVEEKTIWFREELINTLGGKFVFDDKTISFKEGTYKEYKSKYASKSYFSSSSKSGLSVSMTAEGYRKIGVLQRLLENQAIGTGVNGPLLWDEPESNMNPKLVKLLVQFLLELSRNGQQVILATHDYVLLKWFDLLMDKDKDDHVLYHVLYEKNGSIDRDSAESFQQLDKNPITETFGDLYEKELARTLRMSDV